MTTFQSTTCYGEMDLVSFSFAKLCSCLENPRDEGAWWAAAAGVAELDTTKATEQQQQQVASTQL